MDFSTMSLYFDFIIRQASFLWDICKFSALQVRRCRTRRLIKVSTVYLKYVLLKFDEKVNNTNQKPLKQKWTGPIIQVGKFPSA